MSERCGEHGKTSGDATTTPPTPVSGPWDRDTLRVIRAAALHQRQGLNRFQT